MSCAACCQGTVIVNNGPGGGPSTPLEVGCGLTGDGTATAPVAVAPSGQWGTGGLGFPCTEDNGQEIFCDTAGELRTVPARYSRGWAVNQGATIDGPPEPTGTQRLIADLTFELVNPSPCRDMIAQTRANIQGLLWTQTAGNDWSLAWGVSYQPGGGTPPAPGIQQVIAQRRVPVDQASADSLGFPPIDSPISGGGYGYLAPGATIATRAQLFMVFTNTNPAAGADGIPPFWRVQWFELYAEGHSV